MDQQQPNRPEVPKEMPARTRENQAPSQGGNWEEVRGQSGQMENQEDSDTEK